MRILTVAVLVLALIAVPARAQMAGGGGRHHKADRSKGDANKPQVDDKAYKAALERIPEPKEKYDPWAVARPADPDKKSK